MVLLIQWYVVSPIGYGGIFFVNLIIWILLLILAAFLAIPLSGIGFFIKKYRQYSKSLLICSILYITIGIPIVRFSLPIRRAAFFRLAKRSSTLIEAIQNYTKENGIPPKTLDELVPKYISKIPTTGMPAYGQYKYTREKQEYWKGNPWILYLNTTSGGINFDMFIYFPLQNYPKIGYGGRLEKIEKWAYVYE